MSPTQAQDALITGNMGLVHACANRFKGRGVEYEDLFQAGCVGLVKAAHGFDESRGFCFSTYAVPAILGEIRRIFRDGGSVKIGRTAKEKARLLLKIRENMQEKSGKEPAVSEIADKAGIPLPEAAAILCACLPTFSLTSDEDSSETDIPVAPPDEALTMRIDLERAMSMLNEDERELIYWRYEKGLTQTVTAKKMGTTQVQVSRREKQILLKMRHRLQ